jgi:hypothetical protein
MAVTGGRIFVKGLLPECEDEDLHRHFTKFGTVVSATITIDPETLLSRCAGQVQMANPAQVPELLKEEHAIWGHRLTLEEDQHEGKGDAVAHSDTQAGRFRAIQLDELFAPEDVKSYFTAEFGEVADIEFENDENGKWAETAMLRMADPSVLPKIFGKTDHEANGIPFKVRPVVKRLREANYGAADYSDAGRFYIGSLHRDTDDGELATYFSQFGEVDEAVTVPLKEGSHNFFGFVKFTNVTDEISRQMLEETHTIHDRQVNVKPYTRKKGRAAVKVSYQANATWDAPNYDSTSYGGGDSVYSKTAGT